MKNKSKMKKKKILFLFLVDEAMFYIDVESIDAQIMDYTKS